MPTNLRGNREVGNAEAGAEGSGNSTKATVSFPVKHVLQTILQHAAEAFGDKTNELSDVLNPINNPKLREVHWHSSPGNVIEALLYALGLGWSSCGKRLWRRAEPSEAIEWRPPQQGRSLRPAAPRATTLDALHGDELQHAATAAGAGTAAAQRAAEAARPVRRACSSACGPRLPIGSSAVRAGAACRDRSRAAASPSKPAWIHSCS